MKRPHVRVVAAELGKSIRFCATLVGADPAVWKNDHTKWMVDDPRVNFAVSTRGKRRGLDRLGRQAKRGEELEKIAVRLEIAELATQDQAAARGCCAELRKSWSADPQGVVWESASTFDERTTYGKADHADPVQMSRGNPIIEQACACCAQPDA